MQYDKQRPSHLKAWLLRSFNLTFKRTYDRFAFRDLIYQGFPIQLEVWPFVYISEQGSFREYFFNQLIRSTLSLFMGTSSCPYIIYGDISKNRHIAAYGKGANIAFLVYAHKTAKSYMM